MEAYQQMPPPLASVSMLVSNLQQQSPIKSCLEIDFHQLNNQSRAAAAYFLPQIPSSPTRRLSADVSELLKARRPSRSTIGRNNSPLKRRYSLDSDSSSCIGQDDEPIVKKTKIMEVIEEDEGIESQSTSPESENEDEVFETPSKPKSEPIKNNENDKVYLIDGEFTWDEAMVMRKEAQKQFLQSVGRGRRASRKTSKCEEVSSDDDDGAGAVETSCPYCHKSYRQNNSFYKHLYEHHSEWEQVSKDLGLSKHQQVMMMQTAELLLSLRRPHVWGLQPLVRF